jgi:hypothetical protein
MARKEINFKKKLSNIREGGEMEHKEQCCVCGTYYPLTQLKQFVAKGKERAICNECATHIHGLV